MSAVAPATAPRVHRVVVPTLLVIASVIAFWACFAVWVDRQVLNTANWTETSSRLLANPAVEEALATYLVDELYAHEDVPAKLQNALPGELQGLAGPLAAGLRALAGRVVPKLLASAQVQELWRRTNRAAHQELLRILKSEGRALSTSGGVVALNLHELVTELGSQLGVSGQVAAVRSKLSGGTGAAARATAESKLGVSLPASSGRIVIMRSNQLKTAQDIVKAIRGLSLVLPILSALLFALAVLLASDRRRITLRSCGWCLFAVGFALLLIRRVGGETVVEDLVKNPTNKPAAEAVWAIGTSLLYDIALAMIAYGLVIVGAAWSLGTTRPAVVLRRTLAPWLRLHPAGSYGAAGVAMLLLVFWGPTPATRQLLPVLGLAALAAIGVATLRRQTAREFPDLTPAEALAALRGSLSFARRHPAPHASPPAGAAPAPPAIVAVGVDPPDEQSQASASAERS